MSGVGRPPVAAALGKTRVCPHCKATVLESASVCPGCRHHLRFDPGAAQREEASFTAWKVDGVIGPKDTLEACEYSVVIALRNEDGRELARHVVAVGALQPHERRSFTLAVEVIPPRAVAAPRPEPAVSAPKPLPSGINRLPPIAPPPPAAAAGTTSPGGRPGSFPPGGAGGARSTAPNRPGGVPDPRLPPGAAPRPGAEGRGVPGAGRAATPPPGGPARPALPRRSESTPRVPPKTPPGSSADE